MLEQRQGPAPSVSESMRPSSLRVSKEAPDTAALMGLDHPSFRPQKTISQESVNYEDPANIFKMIGAPIQTAAAMNKMVQSGEFRKPTKAEIDATGSRAMDLPFAMTPIGDVADVLGAESLPEAATFAAVAWAPIPTETLHRMFSYVKDNFGRRSGKVLDVLSSIESGGDVAEGIDNTFFRVNSGLSEFDRKSITEDVAAAADEMLDEGIISEEIADHMYSSARIVQQGPKLDMKAGVPESIGPFKLQQRRNPEVLLEYRPDEGYGGATLRKNSYGNNRYEITVVGDKQGASKFTQGRLMAEMIKAVPEGGIVDIGSMSTDSYPYILKYIESGKAEVLNNISYDVLNDMGANPELMARTFGVDPVDVQLTFNHSQLEESAEEIMAAAKRIKPKIDAKLKELGLPESKLVDIDIEDIDYGDSPLEVPYPVVKKKIPTGTYYMGGSLKPVKKKKYVKVT